MSIESDKNFSKWSWYSTDYKNHIENVFENFWSKLLDPQKSIFGDIVFEIYIFLKMKLSKKVLVTKIVLLEWYYPINFFWKFQIIFDVENDT